MNWCECFRFKETEDEMRAFWINVYYMYQIVIKVALYFHSLFHFLKEEHKT